MPRKEKLKIDLSDLPANWTVEDIEKRFPPEIRRRKNPYRLTFKLYPHVGNYDPTYVVEFFASLSMDEKDALQDQFKELVVVKKVMEFNIQSIAMCRADFFDSLIGAINRVFDEAK
jgi:hypothetical protein